MKEISFNDLNQLSGGWSISGFVRKTVIGAVILDALDNIPDIRHGFADGYNGSGSRHK